MNSLTNLLSKLIKILNDNNLIIPEDIKMRYHSLNDLQNRIRTLTRLCTILCPDQAFLYLKDSVVGLSTPEGPFYIYCNPQFWNDFNFIEIDNIALFDSKDYNLPAKQKCLRLESLTNSILKKTNITDEDLHLKRLQNQKTIPNQISTIPPKVVLDTKVSEKKEMTGAINTIITNCIKKGLIDYKQIVVNHTSTEELFNISLELICLSTALCPELSFASTKHFDDDDEMFNDDFIVGFYTLSGPVAFHFKNKYQERFQHVQWLEKAPKYDGYTNDIMLERINSLIALLSFNTTEDITEMIRKNPLLHKSQKPPKTFQYKKV